MAMPRESFSFDFACVLHMAALCLQWPLAQLFLVAWSGVTGQCSDHLSLMSEEIIEIKKIERTKMNRVLNA